MWADHSAKLGSKWKREDYIGKHDDSLLRKARAEHDRIFAQSKPVRNAMSVLVMLHVTQRR